MAAARAEPDPHEIDRLRTIATELPSRRRLGIPRVWPAVVGLALPVALVVGGLWLSRDRFEVAIGSGINPRLEATQVADMARQHLIALRDAEAPDFDVPIDILRVEAWPFEEAFERNGWIPPVEIDPSGQPIDRGVTWVVDANGPFVSPHGPPYLARPRGTHGLLFIDDATGLVVATHFD